jgi:hypothetical protein
MVNGVDVRDCRLLGVLGENVCSLQDQDVVVCTTREGRFGILGEGEVGKD